MTRLFVLGLVALNVLAFVAFALDKLRAVRGGRRVSERALLLLALPLAAAGAWLAMWVFSHKTAKAPFRRLMWLVSVLNVLLLVALWRTLRLR